MQKSPGTINAYTVIFYFSVLIDYRLPSINKELSLIYCIFLELMLKYIIIGAADDA